MNTSTFNSNAPKAWLYFITYFAIAAFIALSLDQFYKEFITPQSIFKKVHTTLNSEPINTIFVGSSHFYAGIRPDAFEQKIAILALPYMDAQQMKRIVEANWENILKAKTIVLEFAPESFTIDALSIYRGQVQRLQELGVSESHSIDHWFKDINRNISSLFPYLMKIRLTPEDVRYSMELANREDPLKEIEKYGFKAHHKTADAKKLKKHTERWIKTMNENYLKNERPTRVQTYQELIKKLSQAGIEVRLLQMPYYSGFRKWVFNENPFFKEELVPTNQMNFLDLNDQVADSFFHDSNHLAPEGAWLASKKINDWLLN